MLLSAIEHLSRTLKVIIIHKGNEEYAPNYSFLFPYEAEDPGTEQSMQDNCWKLSGSFSSHVHSLIEHEADQKCKKVAKLFSQLFLVSIIFMMNFQLSIIIFHIIVCIY